MTALDVLNEYKTYIKIISRRVGRDKDVEKAEIIIAALEKQIAKKPVTNFDRIKAMSVEEMANLLGRNADCENYCAFIDENGVCCGRGNVCTMGVKKWLESELK